MKDRMGDAIGHLLTWLAMRAVDRHRSLARWLDHLPPAWTWRALAVIGLVAGLLVGGFIYGIFFGYLIATKRTKAHPLPIVIALWESNVWVSAILMLPAIAEAIELTDPMKVLRGLTYLVVWIIAMYLIVDLIEPPRRRKRIKVRELVKRPLPDWAT